jgi:hypothetical protein
MSVLLSVLQVKHYTQVTSDLLYITFCRKRPAQELIVHLHGDVTIMIGEGLLNLGLCSTLRAFEQGGIFIAPHLL